MENNKYKRILKNLVKSVNYSYKEFPQKEIQQQIIQTECRVSFDFGALYLNIINYKELGIDISNKMLQKLIKQILITNIYPGREGNYIWVSIGYSQNSPEDKYDKDIGNKFAYISAINNLYTFINILINTIYKKCTKLLVELDDELDYIKIRKENINNYGK